MRATADSYSESNFGNPWGVYTGNLTGASQSITGDGRPLSSAVFYLRKFGSPTGNAVAKLYAHTGVFGTSSVPTGAALATSANLDVSTLTTSYQNIEFFFSGANRVFLTNGTKYCITFEWSGGDGSNQVWIGVDDSSPAHGGNSAWYTSSWVAQAGYDLCFYVYTDRHVVGEMLPVGNCVGLWHLDNDFYDYSGSNYHLTPYGSPTNVTGIFGNGKNFVAASSQYAQIAHASCPNLALTGNRTIICWYKPTTTADCSLVRKQGSSNSYRGYGLMISSAAVRAEVTSLSVSGDVGVGGAAITGGVWQMLALVYDGSNLKVWCNTKKTQVTAQGTSTDSGTPFNIGADNCGAANAIQGYANGVIDEVGVYSRAWSDTEIIRYFNFAKGAYMPQII